MNELRESARDRGYAGKPTGRCACCNAGVIVPGPGVPPFILHGLDRLSGEPCPRREWSVVDAIAVYA